MRKSKGLGQDRLAANTINHGSNGSAVRQKRGETALFFIRKRMKDGCFVYTEWYMKIYPYLSNYKGPGSVESGAEES
ncbi:hypothetical protein HUB94_03815 [Paenibacillus cellulosilyticus]|nr:hypothetical protein HUB94_03815 [Paenibacillus cellulosilyticus]